MAIAVTQQLSQLWSNKERTKLGLYRYRAMIQNPHSTVAIVTQLAQEQRQNAGLAMASCRPRQVVKYGLDSKAGWGDRLSSNN